MEYENEPDYICDRCKRKLMNNDIMQEEVHVHYPKRNEVVTLRLRKDGTMTCPNDYRVEWWCVECAEKKATRTHKDNGDTYYEYVVLGKDN